MAINYTWDVNTVETYPSHGGQVDVIHTVHWRLVGEDDVNNDENGNPQLCGLTGVVNLDVSDLSSFTAFNSVNASAVQGWVESVLGSEEVARLKSIIDEQLTERVTPTSETKIIGA